MKHQLTVENDGIQVAYGCRIVRQFYRDKTLQLVFPNDVIRVLGLVGALMGNIVLPARFSKIKSREKVCVVEIIEGPMTGQRFTVSSSSIVDVNKDVKE